MRYKVFFIIFVNNDIALLEANKWGTKHKFLNLGSNIKNMMLWPFFSSFFFHNLFLKNTSNLFFNVKKSNSRITVDFCSIKLSKKTKIHVSSFNFKQMDMIKFKTLLNNQWPLDWLKTQANTTRERTSTMIWKICHVKAKKHPCSHFNNNLLVITKGSFFWNCNAS
jgi:hypothetical protein